MSTPNIHDHLATLASKYETYDQQKNNPTTPKFPWKEPAFLQNIFSELSRTPPALSQEEQRLIDRLYTDVANLPLEESPELALTFIRTHQKATPLLSEQSLPTNEPTPNFTEMSDTDILKHFKLTYILIIINNPTF